jgi:hypothetical protein
MNSQNDPTPQFAMSRRGDGMPLRPPCLHGSSNEDGSAAAQQFFITLLRKCQKRAG